MIDGLVYLKYRTPKLNVKYEAPIMINGYEYTQRQIVTMVFILMDRLNDCDDEMKYKALEKIGELIEVCKDVSYAK